MRVTNRAVIGVAKLPNGEWKPITMKGVRNYLGCGPEKGRVWMEGGVLVVSGSLMFPCSVVVSLTCCSSQGERWTGVPMLDVVDYLWDWLESFTGKRTRGSRGEAEVAGVPDRWVGPVLLTLLWVRACGCVTLFRGCRDPEVRDFVAPPAELARGVPVVG
jgi:hypothetical protein